ncbi:lys-63-specific deubiquitinase BRCC36-like isoform X1 [Gossypium australe]|uniref:Lys-63-specific deubiquitinase BRCC36-like isoform X1 n=1 Tax=Gossypium australe TaxID=47621 RepID=A0A5B6W9D7_9ROSI|nr:lys-63-specific deubiquitinase BRCC36-like isoform X1 [Gossypium australe]
MGYSCCCLCLFSEESFYRKQQTVPFFSICRIICIDNIGLLWSFLIKCEKMCFAIAVTTFFFPFILNGYMTVCEICSMYYLLRAFLFCIVFYACFSLCFSFKWVVHMEFDQSGIRSVDLGGFFANADANYLGQEQGRGYYNTNNIQNAVVDIDPMDMSESMQEAMHRSNLDMSGAEYVRKEIPLHVLPTSSLVNLDSPLKSFTDLQRVLYEEERAAYNQAILQTMSLSPAISALQDRLKENEIRLAVLTDEAKMLETEASKGSGPSSPHTVSHGFRGSASVDQRDLHSSAEPISMRTFSGPGSRSRKRS